jgi:DNA-binding NarL/FixJ family response regulator
MHNSAGTVFTVGYARELGAGISRILALAGYEVHSFESAERLTRLLAAVAQGVRLDAADRGERAIRGVIKHRLETLTPRETQVMKGILQGRLNKQIAAELGIAHKTTKGHRLRVMSKLRVRSVANLVHLVGRVGITLEPLRTSGAAALKLDAKPVLN